MRKTIKYKLDNFSKMLFFKDFILETIKNFLFSRDHQKSILSKSGNDANSRGRREGGQVLCVVMMQCVQKSTCDSYLNRPKRLQSFMTVENGLPGFHKRGVGLNKGMVKGS